MAQSLIWAVDCDWQSALKIGWGGGQWDEMCWHEKGTSLALPFLHSVLLSVPATPHPHPLSSHLYLSLFCLFFRLDATPPFCTPPPPTAAQSNPSSSAPLWTTLQLGEDERCHWCIVVTATLLCWSSDFDLERKRWVATVLYTAASSGSATQLIPIRTGLTARSPAAWRNADTERKSPYLLPHLLF